MELRDIYMFITGIFVGMVLLLLIAKQNTEPCIKCGKACSDSDIYCSNCGQQLRIVEEFKK
jgi:predicted amidophosphoribosyltransferase